MTAPARCLVHGGPLRLGAAGQLPCVTFALLPALLPPSLEWQAACELLGSWAQQSSSRLLTYIDAWNGSQGHGQACVHWRDSAHCTWSRVWPLEMSSSRKLSCLALETLPPLRKATCLLNGGCGWTSPPVRGLGKSRRQNTPLPGRPTLLLDVQLSLVEANFKARNSAVGGTSSLSHLSLAPVMQGVAARPDHKNEAQGSGH